MSTEQSTLDEQSDLDWDQAREQKTDRTRSRAVVSVAFSRDDFERLDRHVERRGRKISEFIREAALDKMAAEQSPLDIGTAFAAAGYYAPAAKIDFPTSGTGTASRFDGEFVRVA